MQGLQSRFERLLVLRFQVSLAKIARQLLQTCVILYSLKCHGNRTDFSFSPALPFGEPVQGVET